MGNVNDDDWFGADNRKQNVERKTFRKRLTYSFKSRGSKKSLTLAPQCLKHSSHPKDPPVRLFIYFNSVIFDICNQYHIPLFHSISFDSNYI